MTNEVFSLAIDVDVYELSKTEYFVAAIENCGGRHYSDSLSWDEVSKAVDDYTDIVEYFGGGIVILYEKNCDDYDILETWIVK